LQFALLNLHFAIFSLRVALRRDSRRRLLNNRSQPAVLRCSDWLLSSPTIQCCRPLIGERCAALPRLLVIACSQRKRPNCEPLRAIERYDGPPFRVIRRYFRDCPDHDVEVTVLSAKYGLIDGDQAIPNYDQRMSAARAKELSILVVPQFRRLLQRAWDDMAICLGKQYMLALRQEITSQRDQFTILTGGLGRRLTSLRRWLNTSGEPRRRKSSCDAVE